MKLITDGLKSTGGTVRKIVKSYDLREFLPVHEKYPERRLVRGVFIH